MSIPIAVARGDGIGPELVDAVLEVLEAASAPLAPTFVEMGAGVYRAGHSSGMTPAARETVERLGVLLKGPFETPKGHGVKSINVTARKLWSAYANKRTFRTLPGVETPFSHAGMHVDITMIRENIEDTYGAIEHMLTHDVALCRRFITRPGCLQVHRYAFRVASAKGQKRVTCGHKANIMKLTDGLFLDTFYNVAREFPDIAADDLIVDDMAMKLVTSPQRFEVIVLPNLQGDILSDLCAGLVGGLGFAPSANVGDHVAIFEAVHGTAPDIAGRDLANPCALLLSATMMLRHLGLPSHASRVEAALHAALTDGIRTADFGDRTREGLGTRDFARAVAARLSPPSAPTAMDARSAAPPRSGPRMIETSRPRAARTVGVDLFVESSDSPDELVLRATSALPRPFVFRMVSNRGTQVWPRGSALTDCVNQYRMRIVPSGGEDVTENELLDAAARLARVVRVCSVEMLREFDGKAAYSLAHGQ